MGVCGVLRLVASVCVCGIYVVYFWSVVCCSVSNCTDEENQVRDVLTFPNGSYNLLGLFQHVERLKTEKNTLMAVVGWKEFHLNSLVLKHFIWPSYQIIIF